MVISFFSAPNPFPPPTLHIKLGTGFPRVLESSFVCLTYFVFLFFAQPLGSPTSDFPTSNIPSPFLLSAILQIIFFCVFFFSPSP